MPRDDRLVPIGKITGTHGLRGELRVVPYSGDPESILSLRSFLLKGPKGELETFEVAKAALHGKKTVVSLKSHDNISQVLHLVGRELCVRRNQFPELPEGEFYWCDLLGLTVVTEEGEILGRLDHIMATGSNDVYVVNAGGREILIPALEGVILDVDMGKGVVTVSLPEGLPE